MDAQDQTAAEAALRDQPPKGPVSGEQKLTTADLARGQPAPDPTGVSGRQPENPTPALFPSEDAKTFQAR